MSTAGEESYVSATVSGVAPVTLIAQISVALIAVAVTAVYILKHLPDPGENPGPNSGAGSRDSPRRDSPRRLVTSDGNAQERITREAGGAVDNADGRADTGLGSGEDPGSVTRPSTSFSRGEYRDIISHDEYQDLCSSPPEEKPRCALKKGSLSGQSKEWPTSLESIDEEDEEEEDEGSDQRNKNEPKPKQSPKRGSRVPNWYYSRSSSGIPSLPKDRDLDTQFDQLATQSFVSHLRPTENVMYSYQDISHVDDARKRAITGFSGTPIGVLQRKPWPQHQATPSLNGREYSSAGQTYSQSQAMESDHAKIARMNFMLRGRANSFGNSATQDYENGTPVPDIHIHEPNINELSATCGVDDDDSRAKIGSPVWIETLASTVLLPEKFQEELKAEVVQVDVEEEGEGEREEQLAEELRNTVRPRPIPRPRTSLGGVSRTPQGTTSPPSTPVSAPPLFTNGPSRDSDGMCKPTADIDRPQAEERAPNTGAKQPLTNANEGLHQQTKHGDLGNIKTDAALQLGLQTRTGFIKENIDSADNSHNGLPPVASYDDKVLVTITPDSRVFTVVGSTPGPIGSFHTEGDSNGKVVQDVEINLTPDSDIVSPPDKRDTPGGDPVSRDQPVTRRSPYEIGTPGLSTGLSSDEGDLKQDQRAQIVTRQEENTQTDHSRKEYGTSYGTVEPLTAGNESGFTHSKTLHVNSTELNSTDGDNSGKDENTDFPRTVNRENQSADLDEIRTTLTHKLPSKRPKELQLNESSASRDFTPAYPLKCSNGTSVYPHQDQSDSELSSATSPSEVIAQQQARIRRSLEKLNVPDWFKKSNHYKRVVSGDRNRDHSDHQSESEPRMTRSPSSCLSDCWSVTSSEEATNPPAVSTKLAFQSEARYRRDFPKRLLHEPIRNAFSCAELPTQSSTGFTEGDAPNHTSVIDDNEISHSADDTLHGQPLNQTSSSLNDINSGSPPSQSSPSHGLRLRSKSEGDNLDQITYFDSLAVKRLERHMYDSVFFVTGYINDSVDNLDDDQSDKNSLFASGSLPDEPIDDMEYRRQMYELRKSFERDFVLPDLQQRQTDLESDNVVNENGHMTGGLDTYSVPNNREHGSKYSSTTMGSTSTSSPFTTGLYDDYQESRSMKNQTQWRPTPAPRGNIVESPPMEGYSPLARTEAYPAEELQPDPRYNPDGSRNVKLSPRFAMVAPRSNRGRESPNSSTRNTSPRRTTVRIMVTDTSLEDDDSGQSAGHRSDRDPVSASSSDQETVVDGTTNTWTPLDLDKLKDSEFAAVLSVITSRHMKPGNRSALYLPGSGFIPPKEVTMEEIIDSLLGLPYQRATSAIDLNSSGYRGSSSTSTPLTCSTPDLSSSWSPSRGSTPFSSSDKSHSADSLYSEDGNVLNSIIVGRRTIDEGSYHDYSFEEGGSDAIGDEIIMVKCSYKKCAKTKVLAEARKSFKTCHNCYTYYCSRQCRKLHWPRHKKRCLFSRVNSACKHVIYHSRYNGQLQSDLTRVARTGYLSRGRGAILLIFPDTESAENYAERGFDALPSAPTYSTVRELETSSLFGDHMKYLLEMCRSYDPDRKFVLNVAIMANAEEHRGNRPRRTDMAVKKCAKLSLLASHADPSSKNLDPVPDTLIITSPSGPQGDGELDRKSRQVCFVHIQRQLRQRGVNLRHQHSEIYDKLCRWVEDHEHFTPTTIYPLDERTGKPFMCVLMPEAEPDELGWINNPELLQDIDLDAELEKLENVAGMVVTDL